MTVSSLVQAIEQMIAYKTSSSFKNQGTLQDDLLNEAYSGSVFCDDGDYEKDGEETFDR